MRRSIQNLAFCLAAGVVASAGHGAETIRWETDLEAAFEQAQATNRPLLLHFWTPECVPCRRLERTVFNQPRVAGLMHDLFIPVKINANKHPGLASRYGIKSVPNDVIVTPDDEELHRMFTPQDPEQYIAQLSAVAFRSGSTRSPRGPTTQLESQTPGRRSNDSQWSEVTRDIDRRSAYQGSRSSYPPAQTLAASNDRVSARQPDRASAEPREVINRFAHRPETRSPRSEPPRSSDPSEASRWGSWPSGQEVVESSAQANPDRRAHHHDGHVADRSIDHGPRPTDRNDRRTTPVAQRTAQKPPLGLDGYCPVSLLQKNSWTKGDAQFGVIHRGRVYLFVGAEEKESFFSDPDEYSPVLAGVDPVRLANNGDAIIGLRAHGVVYRKRVYLFSSEDNLQEFWKEPERYASPIRQAMEADNVERLFR